MGQYLAERDKGEGEHQRYHRYGEDGIYQSDSEQLYQQFAPVALWGRGGTADGEVVEYMYDVL